MVSYHRNRTVTKPEVDTREWATIVTGWTMLAFGERNFVVRNFGLEKQLNTVSWAYQANLIGTYKTIVPRGV